MVNHLVSNCNFCGSQNEGLLKCINCSYPLSDEICFFDLFLLNEEFKVDKTELYRKYLSLQQKFHPDNWVQKKTYNQHDLERASTLINKAFNTLKDDRKRAEYLLRQVNIFVNSEKDNIKPEPKLLADIFIRSDFISSSNNIQMLKAELKIIEEKILNYFKEFANNFANNLLLIAGQNIIAISYYEKLILEIQHKLEQF